MSIKRFEEIIAWQKAEQLSLEIYNNFKFCKDYAFRDQIQRASVSIMNNIAEGFERRTTKELTNFLYIDNYQYNNFSKFAEEISKLLSGFIKKIN